MADNASDPSGRAPGNGGNVFAVILAIVVGVAVIGCLAVFLGKKSSSSDAPLSVAGAPSTTVASAADQQAAANQQAATPKANCTPAQPATPEGGPPTVAATKSDGTLQKTDDRTGTGPAVKAGDTVVVHYVGALASDGSVFDTSWNKGKPFQVPIGQGNVIEGWDQGIIGMQPGGRRTLVIPSAMGYGPSGQPPKIPANADLVFTVDLLQVCT